MNIAPTIKSIKSIKPIKSIYVYLYTFFKWTVISAFVGLAGGLVGVLFHKSVEYATGFREQNPWLIWLLPAGGLVIVLFYKVSKIKKDVGTNEIISCIRSDEKVPAALAPLIFVSTVITHLFGGSAGRESAALQIGGTIGYHSGRLFRLDEKDTHLIVLCGMSAVFSALFGTPLTAAIFAMEVVSVGVIYYSGLVPCLFSSLVAYWMSLLFGAQPARFALKVIPEISFMNILRVIMLAALCAAVSIIFCVALHKTHTLLEKLIKNDYLRIAAGGFAMIALTYLLGTYDYNGAGMDLIARAVNGEAKPEAFLLKILFTAITIGAGYKGGEIVPTFFIGATFGCAAGGLLGLDAGFGAAVGIAALFCGVVNCPVTSVFLSIELFGAEGVVLFMIACAVTNLLSGNYGLYKTQKIIYSKLKAEFINVFAK
ncbi:MAG TPA: chloride channel protein [Bacillota bacterium]|nr:chloride channel protein [Bacillota bacterium]HPP85704.1 chloride channel protein [Bacillota bacterium]